MALIDLKTNLAQKIGGTNTTETGKFRVNQGDNTERKTNFSDEVVQQQYSKLSPSDDQLIRKDVGEKSAMSKQDVWYSQLPNDEFTTAQAYEVAKQTVKVSTRTVDTWLTSKDFIKGDTNGKYTKNFEI